MSHRMAPLLSSLLLLAACDNAKTEAKPEAKKTAKADADAKKTADADAKKAADADAEKAADADADPKKADADAKKADAETADAKTPEQEAKEAEERKARIAKRLAEVDEWAAAEKGRWTAEVESGVAALVAKEVTDPAQTLAAILASPHRHPDNTARDEYRHPAETMVFFGLRPDMTVVEVGPGWGWYTEILAPMLAGQGKLVVTTADPDGPEDKGSTIYGRRFRAFAARSEAAYGKIETLIQGDGLDLGPDGSADMVFIARGLHGWVSGGAFDDNVAKVYAALEPGGVAAIVQHRAKDDATPEESAKQGYLPQPWVIERFEAAGFTLGEASEINANPKDTKDHPEGVWTLPPTLALGDQDRDKYVGIGESDRMTLRFVKPAS